MFDKKKKTFQRQKQSSSGTPGKGAKDKGFGRPHTKGKPRVLREEVFMLSSCKSHPKTLQTVQPTKKKRNVGGDRNTSIISVTLTASSDCDEHSCGICLTFSWHITGDGKENPQAMQKTMLPLQDKGCSICCLHQQEQFRTQSCYLDIWVI